jgi:site-specific DNA recombinase
LLKAIARAHCWFDDLKAGSSYKTIANREGIDQRHIARTIRLAFLAPNITEAILKGREPQDLTTDRLLRLPKLPIDWQTQRELLGFI